jgi:L-alanine-DL-glutamate epimerase-like enolase superfamily enzyme
MIITDITAKIFSQELLKPLIVALGAIRSSDTVIVKIETDAGIIGYGEGSSAPFISGESADIILSAVGILKTGLIGEDPLDIADIHATMDRLLVRNGAAKAAIDLAVYDIIGKHESLPLYKLLGGADELVETDITIMVDSPERMAEEARKCVADGFRQLKIKAGVSCEDDIQAIRQIRSAVGPGVGLKVDANQGWTAEQALKVIESIKDCAVGAIEQPVPWWDFEGLRYISSHSDIDIMADESCFNRHDAARIVKEKAADMINIKLMKCGGLFRAIQINEIAENHGLRCMVGCMAETRIGIAAAAAFAKATSNVVYADLDGFLYFTEDKKNAGGFTFEAPFIKLSANPGHGVEVDF